ncbi:MAG: uracil-DNA glycosylase family protein [Pseudomonadota bacterium]
MISISDLKEQISSCKICATDPIGSPLPHDPRPVAVISEQAKIRIIGQAPGTRVHESGRPFTDPSGDRLRDWMGIDEEDFYNPDKLAITPMGFCFPGLDAKGGDLPPRKECAKRWQNAVSDAMPQIELVLLIGMYAQKHYLRERAEKTLTATVKNWKAISAITDGVKSIPLPHPSWRNNAWIKKNPWFSSELLPFLRGEIQASLQ